MRMRPFRLREETENVPNRLLKVEPFQEAPLQGIHHHPVIRVEDADKGDGFGMADPHAQSVVAKVGNASQIRNWATEFDRESAKVHGLALARGRRWPGVGPDERRTKVRENFGGNSDHTREPKCPGQERKNAVERVENVSCVDGIGNAMTGFPREVLQKRLDRPHEVWKAQPEDSTWRCGVCLTGLLTPNIGAVCDTCQAQVTQVFYR